MTPKISIILPCYNEESAISYCIESLEKVILDHDLSAEILISDSSSDNSKYIAQNYNVRIISHNKIGYGAAYLEALKHVQGEYIVLVDLDGTYDFNEIPKLIDYLNEGYDFVIGNRFNGTIHKGAMPLLNRYIGNPFLTFLAKIFYNLDVNDVHCGMRAFTKKNLGQLNLQTTGMEFATEMVVKASKINLKIKEIPINYYKRIGKSKLKPIPDAFRHIKFIFSFKKLYNNI